MLPDGRSFWHLAACGVPEDDDAAIQQTSRERQTSPAYIMRCPVNNLRFDLIVHFAKQAFCYRLPKDIRIRHPVTLRASK